MPTYFVDSSALVKAYVAERGSRWVRDLLQSAELGDIYIAVVTPVEVTAALSRRSRGTDDLSAKARAGVRQFREALDARAYSLVELVPATIDSAMHLAETYHLRGYDAVQLACALAVRRMQQRGEEPLLLLSADIELNAAALQEALTVENPDDHG
ncbi:type II toxin-antitoxin system VapC family toxin [Candidatus Poribacteria bacterium]|nr:type II toxin-antitoxin system VapC family toxin [Candidatus Poribacteria bacterium]MBT5535535.1 type II toxin-antitoxin system VapC family toxin [Candidatus Poribacteria bacterium]MBT5712075.1 type II toxin-antitoxin system VapC family toxin [Candidatus Poribacteria bacterium]MBT7099467.1 type II toxin-antitoxin system VapC family toxin [Candidatus Poribacteria bacterium]MBT7808538.1 type II toxin-antitoxin system VapC family toxin [Candidatus Poribacteria bacterium]